MCRKYVLFTLTYSVLIANNAGDLDTTFNSSGSQPGVVTSSISPGGSAINALALQTDGNIVVGGYSYSESDNFNVFTVGRYTSGGSLDSSFGGSGYVTTDFAQWPGGEETQPQGPTEGIAQGVAIQSNGQIVAIGEDVTPEFSTTQSQGFALVRFNTNGGLDTSFGSAGLGYEIYQFGDGAPARGYALYSNPYFLSDGEILCSGLAGNDTSDVFQALGTTVLFLSNGSDVDDSFADIPLNPTPGAVQEPGFLQAQYNAQTINQNTGQIYTGGWSYGGLNYNFAYTFMTGRFNSDGTVDESYEYAPAPAYEAASTGLYDTGSPAQGNAIAYYAPTDQLYIGGFSSLPHDFETPPGPQLFTIGRINTNASPDTSFGSGSPYPGFIYMPLGSAAAITGLAIDPNDNRVIAGGWATYNGANYFILAKYNFDGSLYDQFGVDGIVTTTIAGASSAQINAITLEAWLPTATKIVVGGVATIDGTDQFILARYLNPTDFPTADNGSATADASLSTVITLTATDPAGLLLTFSITSNPTHGTVVITDQPVTGATTQTALALYTPTLTYSGIDSFMFNVTNQTAVSNDATFTLTVIDVVFAFAGSGECISNVPTKFNFSGFDGVALPLTFDVVTPPAYGAVNTIFQPIIGSVIQTATFIYTSSLNYVGLDQFMFAVTDGSLTSTPVPFSLTITDSVLAFNNYAIGRINTPIPATLTGYDYAQALLTFAITQTPAHGTLSAITQPPVADYTQTATTIYSPDFNFIGLDYFMFDATNGTETSTDALITLSVLDVPTAYDASYSIIRKPPAAPSTLILTASDPLSALLTFEIVTEPLHGTLSVITQPTTGAATQFATVVYTPFGCFVGTDSFTFQVHNSLAFSAPSNIATVTVNTHVPFLYNADPFTLRLINKYNSCSNTQPITLFAVQDPFSLRIIDKYQE